MMENKRDSVPDVLSPVLSEDHLFECELGLYKNLTEISEIGLAIHASRCASERVRSASGYNCTPRHMRLSEEHVDTLIFQTENYLKCKELNA